ncbi:S49 family peptidase [Serratia quinivorans]|uniref:Protease 4 n=3 Tax=Serratia TaxID=613 RepID=A0A379YE03_9GAMM|nr:S49 family peptidase [Serratia quinivorans]CAI1718005.1 Protease 4 [Serratia quinivorans]SUI43933.1 Protease 4 [Serratia quinivorans]
MQWPSYQHLAARVFNQPLLLEPAYARVFFSVLGERLGASRLVDAVTGQAYAGDALKKLAFGWDDDEGGRRTKSYRVENGIAVLPVTGTLVHKFGYVQPFSGMTGYDGIITRLQLALDDPAVKGILLDIDSPGGEVAGAFDTADLIARARDKKPVWSLANDMACSAGYLLASACSQRLITQTGVVGSIGVVVAHRSLERALEQAGVDITLIYAGAHKVDGNPYQQLPDDVRADIQTRVDESREMFAVKVAEYTGLPKKAVLSTEANVYEGDDAIKAGLAGQIVNYADAVSVMADAVKPKGVYMTTKATAQTPENTTTEPAAVNQPKAGTLPDTGAIAMATATEEMTRIMSILECDEALGREAQAKALAKVPGMTLDAAKAVLSASPLSAQARTETALDALMEKESPDAVSGGEPKKTDADTRMGVLNAAVERLTGE